MTKQSGAPRAVYGVIFAALALAATAAAGEVVTVQKATITQLYAYGAYGTGDVIFDFTPKPSGCEGGWIDPANAGARNVFATLISARLTATPLTVITDTAKVWPGSGTRYCTVFSLGL